MLQNSASSTVERTKRPDTRKGTAAIQGEIWGARARDWADVNEPAWRSIFEAAVKQAGVAPGKRYLDIGCGAGGALVAARDRGAEVAGLDASERLVAIARERLPGARIEVGEMEDLPFEQESFDVVTGINSFQFAGDMVAALAEARRVLRRDGTLLVLVWGKREDCELISGTARAVFALLPVNREARPSLPLHEPGVIEGLLRQSGLQPADSGELAGPAVFADATTAIRAVLSASARAIHHAGEEAVTEAIRETLPPFTQSDGSIVWNNRFRWATATRG